MLIHSAQESIIAFAQVAENLVLSVLNSDDRKLLMPLLHRMELPVRKSLEISNKRIEFVYFPVSGMASVVAECETYGSAEIGVVGREGVTGAAIIMASDRSPHQTYMQVAGEGYRISANALRDVMAKSPSLHRILLRSTYVFTVQTAHTALVNSRFKLEERLARWLLMGYDRIDGDELQITHEFLALMLGVRRAGVTEVLRTLQDNGLIRTMRRGVRILDRHGLREWANGAYGVAEAELTRVMR